MTAPLSDEDLLRWAREHLVYEGRMLAFTAVRLAERQGSSADPESNTLLESFVVHVRCLRDFLWGDRKGQHKWDAFAADFCEPGEWERERGEVPSALAEIDELNRAGREVVHLSYHRLTIEAASKDWDCGDIYGEIADVLGHFAVVAKPSRLDRKTSDALLDLPAHSAGVRPASVATGAVYGLSSGGGPSDFPRFQHGS